MTPFVAFSRSTGPSSRTSSGARSRAAGALPSAPGAPGRRGSSPAPASSSRTSWGTRRAGSRSGSPRRSSAPPSTATSPKSTTSATTSWSPPRGPRLLALTAAAYAAGEVLAPEARDFLGAGAAAALVVVPAVLGFSLLEIVSYLEHCGLERLRLPNARYERVTPLHCWSSNHLVTNGFLYHLPRRSDHHARPGRRHGTLRSFPVAPQLPTGDAGMILLAAVPPLWFRVMDARVLDFRERQARSEVVEGQGIVA